VSSSESWVDIIKPPSAIKWVELDEVTKAGYHEECELNNARARTRALSERLDGGLYLMEQKL
jgi:hypothetical protein